MKHAEGWNLSLCQWVKIQQQFFFLLFEKKTNQNQPIQVISGILNDVHFLPILYFEVGVVFLFLISLFGFFKDSFSLI